MPTVSAPTAASPSGLNASRSLALVRATIGFISEKSRARSGRFARQDQRGVLAAEAERIRHDSSHARIARLVTDDVELDGRIRDFIIDRRRNPLMLEREQRNHGFDRTGR